MRTDRIGFYAPYDWDEATYAAISLAELARKQGQVPSFRAHGKRRNKDNRVHADWDDAVTWGLKGLKEWIAAQRVIVWFEPRKELLNYAKKQGVKNVFVPMLHRLEHHTLRDLKLFDAIHCPNELTHQVLLRAGLNNTINVPWDAGLPLKQKVGLFETGRKRVLVIPEWPITNEWGLALAYMVRTLLDAQPDVDITIVQQRQWPKIVNRAMRDLTDQHACRVCMFRAQPWHSLFNAYQAHDWILYLPEKINIGVRLAEVFSQGLPVLALDLPPVREFVKDDVSAYLIPCAHTQDILGRPTAMLNTHNITEAMGQAIDSDEIWRKLTIADREPALQRRREYFESEWAFYFRPF